MKIKKYLGLISVFVFSSCNFLDTESFGYMEQDKLYHDENSCLSGLRGVYDQLGTNGTYGLNLWGDLDAGTDIMVYNRGYGANEMKPALYNYNNTHTAIEETWKNLYAGINRANDFIEVIEKRDASECGGKDKKQMFIAEAKALRAIYYMNLVAFWGEVPLRLEATRDLTTQQIKKSSQEEIYNQIIADLIDAEKGCIAADELDSPGRISKTTVQALLARAYMWMAGYPVEADTWNQALFWARQVKSSGLHSLCNEPSQDPMYPNGYHTLFINMCSNKYDLTYRESMLEVEFYGNGNDKSNESGKVGLYNGISWGMSTDPDMPFAYAWYNATKILFSLYEDNDARKWWNCAEYTFKDDGSGKAMKVYVDKSKYIDGNPGKWRAEYDPVRPWARNNSSINFPIMRYSDVLLMIAECSAVVNNGPTQEAVDALNEVRGRAGASLKNISDFADYGEFVEFVREERTRELCFEVPRHMELRRCGKDYYFRKIRLLASQDMDQNNKQIGYDIADVRALPGINIVDKHLYLPIPQTELNTNPICGQTEGW